MEKPASEEPTVDSKAEAHKLLNHRHGYWSSRATAEQRSRLRFSMRAAVLGPTAVAVLLIQILFFGDGRTASIILIFVEFLILLFVLAEGLGLMGPKPREWTKQRLRAELLRREMFMLDLQVGPYLGKGDEVARATKRIALIEDLSGNTEDLIELRDPGYRSWRDSLEDHVSEQPYELPADLVNRYIEGRIRNQKNWHLERARHHGHIDHRLEIVLTWTLIFGVVWSASHLIMLATMAPAETGGVMEKSMEFLATLTPALAAGVVGIQSILQSGRIVRSYQRLAHKLTQIEVMLLEACHTEAEGPGAALQRGRLVLRAEEALAHQLEEWWLVVNL